MRIAIMALGLAGVLAAAGSVRAAGDSPATTASAGVTNAATPEITALRAEEIAVDNQIRALTADIIKLLNPIREAREKALKTDPELQAMFREIAKRQEAMEKRLVEKYPDLAAKAKESEKLTAEHSKLNAKLMEIREKLATLTGEPGPSRGR